jgi:pentose-5-phosphate-3-epimerase
MKKVLLISCLVVALYVIFNVAVSMLVIGCHMMVSAFWVFFFAFVAAGAFYLYGKLRHKK